jgi:TPR repeat protein
MRRICLTLSCLLPLFLTGITPADSQGASEITFWESVRNTRDPAELQAYLEAYPSGQFAPLARLRLNKLQEPAGEPSQASDATDTAPVSPSAAVEVTPALPDDLAQKCDLMTASPVDDDKVAKSVEFDWIDGPEAVRACTAAVNDYPQVARYRYQLSRALEKAGDHPSAIRHLRSAADDGYPAAMVRLGYRNLHGENMPFDTDEAVRWFHRAAKSGSAHAMTVLGILYLEGKELPQDLPIALDWHLKAAANGESQAMYNLGFMYLNGAGVPKDPAKGVQWLRQAAEKGYANAALELAQMYERGGVVASNPREALNWYMKASENGSAYANYNLARLFLQGRSVDRDDKAASFLFQALQGGYIIGPDQLAAEGRTWGRTFWSEFQRILKEEGFYAGGLDGGFGPQTKRAIEALSDARFVETDRTSPADTDDRPMLVNIPELNVFPRPSMRANRIGAVVMGDRVTARRWSTDAKGDRWARICTYRFCGWVAAEFLKDPPAQAPTQIEPAPPDAIGAPEKPADDVPAKPEEGLGTLD